MTSAHQAPPHRMLITVCAMTATIMQALDTTIANVALPYMQGSLSASLDQINWVLTSYIVAAAIMTAPVGWLADRFGRKAVFITCVAGFTTASLLCALAQNIEQMVLFRLLQGMAGAALVPLSQASMLDLYSAEERNKAMAIWGIGVMLGPIMGPTLGAWLTDNYSWHWVFLINLPIGILTVAGMIVFMKETKTQDHLRFDWFGFLALAIGIGSLQLLLDRGEQVGWFGATEIWIETIVSASGFYYFFAHSLTTTQAFVNFDMFKDRNFVSGCVFMVVIGVVLFGTMALVTPFMQNLLGYPIQTAGFLLGSRGVGTLLTMMVAPRLMRLTETRNLIFLGLVLTAGTLYEMTGWSLDTTQTTIILTNMVQGVGLGLLFVPITAVAFLTLPMQMRNGAAAITTLVRNIGSSIGISMMIANLTSKTTMMHERIGAGLTPFNDALQMPDVANTLKLTTEAGKAVLDGLVTQRGGFDRLSQRLQTADGADDRRYAAGADDRPRPGKSRPRPTKRPSKTPSTRWIRHRTETLSGSRRYARRAAGSAVSPALADAGRAGRRDRCRAARGIDGDASQVGMRRQQGGIVDTSKSDVRRRQLCHQRLDILRTEHLGDLGVGGGTVGVALRIGREPFVDAERGIAQHLVGQRTPFAVVLDRDQNVGAIAGLEYAVRRDGRMRQADALERTAPFLIEQRDRHPLRHGVEHRNRNRRAFAGTRAAEQGFQNGFVGA